VERRAHTGRATFLDSAPRRVTSSYPAAPPGVVITPSHTPWRAASVEPDDTPLTSADILRLYEKLNVIEETKKNIITWATAMLASTAADRRGRTMTNRPRVSRWRRTSMGRPEQGPASDAQDGRGRRTIFTYLFIIKTFNHSRHFVHACKRN